MSHAAPDANDAGPERATARSWYVLAVLTGVAFFAYMDRMAIAILLEPIKADLKLSDAQLGLLSGLAFAFFYATLGVPLARIADRGSRVKLLSVCLALWSLMTAVSGFAKNFPQLFLARMGVGVGEAGCVPPAHSLISDYFPRDKRPLAISIFQCGAVVGMSGGLFFIGMMGQELGWRLSLQIIGVAGLPLALLVFLTVKDPPRPAAYKADGEPALKAVGDLLKRPAFVHLMIGYALSGGCVTGVGQWFPAFFMRTFDMTVAQVGAWSGGASLIGGIAGLLTGGYAAGKLVKRDPRWELWLPALAIGACAPLYALMFMAPNPWISLVAKAAGGYLGAIGSGVALAAIQSMAEPNRRATAASLVLFVSSLLGMGGAPYAIGLVSDLLAPTVGDDSLRYGLLLTCVVLVWSVFHFVISARHGRQAQAQAEVAAAAV